MSKEIREAIEALRKKAKENDMFDEILTMSKTSKGREELMEVADALKAEFYPMLDVAKEVIGKDLDKFVDEALRWSARKAKVAYDAYIIAGFSSDEAIALTIRSREDFAATLRSVKR